MAILVSSVYAFVFTWVMLWIITKTTGVKTSETEEGLLDESLHGESAYERGIQDSSMPIRGMRPGHRK